MSSPNFGQEERDVINKVFDSNWPTEGKITKTFEKKLSSYLNTQCVVVNNGSSAIMSALLANDIKPGDKVVVPAFTYVATSSIPKILGAKIIVVDIDLKTFNIDLKILEKILKENDIKFVLAVDVGGLPVDIESLIKLSKKYNFIIIEDAAQSFGSEYKTKKVGSFEHLTVFSFQITKQLTTIEGGCVASSDKKMIKKIHKIKDYGRTDQLYVHDIVGTNFRTTDLQSAIGIEQLKKIDDHVNRRNKIAESYRKNLKKVKFQEIPDYVSRHSYMLFFVKAKNEEMKNHYIKILNQNDIDARKTWLPIHLQPCNSELNFMKNKNAEMLHKQLFTIPIYNNMDDHEANIIIDLMKDL